MGKKKANGRCRGTKLQRKGLNKQACDKHSKRRSWSNGESDNLRMNSHREVNFKRKPVETKERQKIIMTGTAGVWERGTIGTDQKQK